jgi:hypothetical protein
MSQTVSATECQEARDALDKLEIYAANLPTVYRSAMKLIVATNRVIVNQKCKGVPPAPPAGSPVIP